MLKTGDLNGMIGGLAIQKRHRLKIQIQRKGRPNRVDKKITIYLRKLVRVSASEKNLRQMFAFVFCLLLYIFYIRACPPRLRWQFAMNFPACIFRVFQVCAGCVQNTN